MITAMKPGIHFEPTSPELVERMLDLAEVKPDEVLFDLGCGDGRILAAAGRRNAIARGWDCDPTCLDKVSAAMRNIRVWGVEIGNLFDVDLSSCDVVTAYLSAEMNARLLPQLATMKPGSRFISNMFGLPGVQPTKKEWHKDRYILRYDAPI